MAGREVYVVGGANSAVQAALHLALYARRVTLLVRAKVLDVGMSSYLVGEVEEAANIEVRLETEVVGGGGEGALEHLVLRDRVRDTEYTVPADGLFLIIGAHPHTGWLPDAVRRDGHGYVLTGSDLVNDWPLERQPFSLETSMPCVFAVGAARRGSVKRVASAVGEGSIAIQLLHALLSGNESTRDRPASSLDGYSAPVAIAPRSTRPSYG